MQAAAFRRLRPLFHPLLLLRQMGRRHLLWVKRINSQRLRPIQMEAPRTAIGSIIKEIFVKGLPIAEKLDQAADPYLEVAFPGIAGPLKSGRGGR
jgi:hypothetical protein